MSKRSSDARPRSRHEAGPPIQLPPLQPRYGTGPTSMTVASQESHYQRDGSLAAISPSGNIGRLALPLDLQSQAGEKRGLSPVPSRSLGVHSILNPPEEEYFGSATRHFTGDVVRIQSAAQPTVQDPASHQPVDYLGVRPGSHQELPHLENGNDGKAPRRILTPRSPRAASYGSRHSPSQPMTFPGGPRSYSAQTGSSTTPLMHTQQSPDISQGASAEELRHRPSMPTISIPSHSMSASPTPSISSFGSQAPQIARTPHASTAPSGQYFQGQSYGPPRASSPVAGGSYASEGHSTSDRSVVLQGAQTNMRMMPLTSADGTQFYVSVDVQAASKVADEKRARNAGASARFRERRKAKEKEASTAIQKLEQTNRELERRNRELEEQTSRIREERDHYRDLVHRTPELSKLASQPPSATGEKRQQPPHGGPPPGSAWQSSAAAGSQELDQTHQPARRQRTEEHLQYGSYAYPSPATRPPAGPSFPHPGPTSHANLPPMRPAAFPPLSTPGPTAAVIGRPPYDSQYPREQERNWPPPRS